MLVLGPDALEGFRTALADLMTDLDSWHETSLSTNYST